MLGMSTKYCIMGGTGYVGYHIGKALAEAGHQVVLFDICEPYEPLIKNMAFVKGNICNLVEVISALSGVHCVFHVASYGMSGREQLDKVLIEQVNIGGTKNAIEACCHQGVTRMVYTSTFNVIYGGEPIKNGDESLPYFPLYKHVDHYSRTKSIAEQMILLANGKSVKGHHTLKTCALRLAGIYGPGERRHLPRIVDYIERGYFCFTFGTADSLVEFVRIDNLVQAHILAAAALTADRDFIAAGLAYFISDGKPINNFEFFQPLIEYLGYKPPMIKLPFWFVFFTAFLIEQVYNLVGRYYNFQPLLTRTEVYKTGVTHYFSLEKAKQDLCYQPQRPNDLSEVMEFYHKKRHTRKYSVKIHFLINILIATIFTILILSFLPMAY